MRTDERTNLELRPVEMEINPLAFSDGSVTISTGKTKVLCSASLEEGVPSFLAGQNKGWITAEYSMLPGSTSPRSSRGNSRRGRSQEISRLIGRCLRASADLDKLGEYTINIDCDVLQADGGTRTASITGGYVAMVAAVIKLKHLGLPDPAEIFTQVAATSIGIFNDQVLVDLCYEEDSVADADFNIVMASDGKIVEIQGAAEGNRYSIESVHEVLDVAKDAFPILFRKQKSAILMFDSLKN
ncbi:ribonuclease PH [Dehalococcoidia bacterium]|nr:ribonuclease PH [Dehalococcoidia bacterium]